MKRVFTSKQQRKQAEAAIIRYMTEIKSGLDAHRAKHDEPVDKEQIMSVLTKFVKLKKETRIH